MQDNAIKRQKLNALAQHFLRSRLFEGMGTDEITLIIGFIGGGVRRFAKGDIVVHEGTKAKWVIPVLKGRLNVYESGASGDRHLVRVIDEGGLFGSTLVTANLEDYPGMAVAEVDSEVVFFDNASIKALWREGRHPRFFVNLYSIVSGEVLDCWRKISMLTCRKTEDRFMLYLHWLAAESGETEVKVPFPTSEACAQFLGVTRTALSLAVKRLITRGEITRLEHGRFVLKHLGPRRDFLRIKL